MIVCLMSAAVLCAPISASRDLRVEPSEQLLEPETFDATEPSEADEAEPDPPDEPQPAEVEPPEVEPEVEAAGVKTEATVSPAPQEPVVDTSEAAKSADTESEEKKKSKLEDLSFKVGGRVMAGWEIEDRRPADTQEGGSGLDHGFFLQQARAKLGIDYTKRFTLRLSIELADALKSANPDRVAYLRNGYGGVRFHDAIRLQFGYFKRPFSRLELRSPGRLPIRGRGLANSRLIEDRNFGDRSVGGMLWGRIRPARMKWYAGVFSPATRAKGVDAIGRLEADPLRWLSLGGGGGYKRIEDGTGETVNVGSANVDLRTKFKGLYVLADLILAQDYLLAGRPWALGVVGYVRYNIDLPKKLELQPVVSAEWADTNLEVSENDAVRSVAGLNLIWRKRFRIMPQAEFIRPLGVIDNPWNERDRYYVMLSLQI